MWRDEGMNGFWLSDCHEISLNVPASLEMSALADVTCRGPWNWSKVEGNTELPFSNLSLLRTQHIVLAFHGRMNT